MPLLAVGPPAGEMYRGCRPTQPEGSREVRLRPTCPPLRARLTLVHRVSTSATRPLVTKTVLGTHYWQLRTFTLHGLEADTTRLPLSQALPLASGRVLLLGRCRKLVGTGSIVGPYVRLF